jgi:uncharacterized membrane protein YfcA
MALCNIAGIGGGGIIVPLTMSFFSFDTKDAITISGFSIFTGSLARFIYNRNNKHPEKDATDIDYGVASVMLPTVLIGSYLGVFINVMFPAMILQIILFLLLASLSINSGCKACSIYKVETTFIESMR